MMRWLLDWLFEDPPPELRRTGGNQILVVAPDPRIRRLIEVNLGRAGYRVLLASSGEDALKLAHEKPSLVILDERLDDADPFEILKEVRLRAGAPELPCIWLLEKEPRPDHVQYLLTAVDCYLTKPFNPMELLTFVKRIFDSTGSGGAAYDRIYSG